MHSSCFRLLFKGQRYGGLVRRGNFEEVFYQRVDVSSSTQGDRLDLILWTLELERLQRGDDLLQFANVALDTWEKSRTGLKFVGLNKNNKPLARYCRRSFKSFRGSSLESK